MRRFRLLIPLLTLLSLLSPLASWAQSGTIVGQAVAPTFAAPNPSIRVCPYIGGSGLPCSPLSNIYSDSALTIPIANPSSGDQYGNFSFFTTAGLYIVQVTPIFGITYTYLYTVQNGSINIVTGSGTVNTLAKWTGTGSIGNSSLTDNGTTLSTPLTLTLNGTILNGSGGGGWTFRNTTDNVVGAATTDTLTGKTFDTSGSGNIFKIAGNTISSVSGTGLSAVLSTGPTISNANLTGIPTAPTAAAGTNTNQLATMAALQQPSAIPVNGIVPGSNGQCAITSGGVTTWGACSGVSSATVINADITTPSVNGNTTAFQSLHAFNLGSGSRNFAKAKFHTQSQAVFIAVNTSETIAWQIAISDGVNNATSGILTFTPASTSGASCCTMIIDVYCTVLTPGTSGTMRCSIQGLGQNLGNAQIGGVLNLIGTLNTTGVITLTEQASFTSASTTNVAGSDGFFVYQEN